MHYAKAKSNKGEDNKCKSLITNLQKYFCQYFSFCNSLWIFNQICLNIKICISNVHNLYFCKQNTSLSDSHRWCTKPHIVHSLPLTCFTVKDEVPNGSTTTGVYSTSGLIKYNSSRTAHESQGNAKSTLHSSRQTAHPHVSTVVQVHIFQQPERNGFLH